VRGGAEKIQEAKCVLIGGHTIKIPEPVFGYAVTGMVSPRRMMTNANARPGDLLILTKPLGTGIITTGIKRGLATPALEKKAIDSMTHLNTVGADVAERGLVRAGVDVTGFGLLSHLGAMCASSKVGAEISAGSVPAIGSEVFDLIAANCIPGGSRDNRIHANEFAEWVGVTDLQKTLLTDAQTSGGLLLCVPPRNQKAVMKRLERAHTLCAAVIGRIVRSAKPRIRVSA
jgi:selenide,water dikinase